jgi:steroid delta-isomerase-like uncharacterized protein
MNRFGRALAAAAIGTALANSAQAGSAPDFSVGPQYDTTHVYVPAGDFDNFVASFQATFGGTTSKQGVFQVTPTPSKTISQLALTPAGTISVFGFTTPVPYPFGIERTGYLVSDFDGAMKAAKASGADVIVAPFPDPIGRDAVISWPGGTHMQIYWHTTPPHYAPLATIPENRVYVSPLRAAAFVRAFLTFSHGKIVSDDAGAPGIEIGKPTETFRRIRIESGYGKMAVFVTDGHLPWPYGHELTGYEVSDLNATLAKARAAGVEILVPPFSTDGRISAMVRFPGGYIAEIHAPGSSVAGFDTAIMQPASVSPVGKDDLVRWQAAWNSHDIDTVLALFAADVVIHQPSNPKPLDYAGARNFFSMIFKAYPDFHIDVTNSVIEGSEAVSIERVTGTWSGTYTDPATGKTTAGNGHVFDHPGVMVITYEPDHRIGGLDIYWDRLVVDQQLGISP